MFDDKIYNSAEELKNEALKLRDIIAYSKDVSDINRYYLCGAMIRLAELDGHVCRVKEENYAVHRISIDLINASIPAICNVYRRKVLKEDLPELKIEDLYGDYSKEEVFAVRIILKKFDDVLDNTARDLVEINKAIDNFKPAPILEDIFHDMLLSELEAMSRDDLEDYIVNEKGYSDDNAIAISTIFDMSKNTVELLEDIFINRTPVISDLRIPLPDRISAFMSQMLLQDEKNVRELLNTV